MNFLLDTHVLVWLTSDPEKIHSDVRNQLLRADRLVISVVAAWEYQLKRRKKPDQLPVPISRLLAVADFELAGLPFECHHHAENLPAFHNDPFDRMMIAHAIVGGLVFVTKDETIRRYPVETLW